MAPTAVPRPRHGDDPSLRDRAEIGVLLDRHHDRLFNIVLHIVGAGADSDADAGWTDRGGREDRFDTLGDAGAETAAAVDPGPHAVAAEVTRNAFFQIINSSEPQPSMAAVVRAVVRTALIHRRRGTAAPRGADDQGAALRAQCRAADPSTAARHPYHAALQRIDEGLCGLLVLRDVEGMAYRQIADVMEMSLADVKRGLLRARLALRRQILTASGAADAGP